jgi:hypothetical protein
MDVPVVTAGSSLKLTVTESQPDVLSATITCAKTPDLQSINKSMRRPDLYFICDLYIDVKIFIPEYYSRKKC